MKVIQLHHNEKRLIKKAIKKNRAAQQSLYESYAPKMLSVCRMYIKDLHFAEDVMLKAFFKVFTNLEKFRDEGSFEGWIRKIMLRESIDFLRSQKQIKFSEDLIENSVLHSEDVFSTNTEIDYLQNLIDELPEGYKIVFMMYAVEGYKHQEIAKTLGISEGTSKSQLSKARKMLQEKLNGKKKKSNGDE